jgi:hypothetical protein
MFRFAEVRNRTAACAAKPISSFRRAPPTFCRRDSDASSLVGLRLRHGDFAPARAFEAEHARRVSPLDGCPARILAFGGRTCAGPALGMVGRRSRNSELGDGNPEPAGRQQHDDLASLDVVLCNNTGSDSAIKYRTAQIVGISAVSRPRTPCPLIRKEAGHRR